MIVLNNGQRELSWLQSINSLSLLLVWRVRQAPTRCDGCAARQCWRSATRWTHRRGARCCCRAPSCTPTTRSRWKTWRAQTQAITSAKCCASRPSTPASARRTPSRCSVSHSKHHTKIDFYLSDIIILLFFKRYVKCNSLKLYIIGCVRCCSSGLGVTGAGGVRGDGAAG